MSVFEDDPHGKDVAVGGLVWGFVWMISEESIRQRSNKADFTHNPDEDEKKNCRWALPPPSALG